MFGVSINIITRVEELADIVIPGGREKRPKKTPRKLAGFFQHQTGRV
jgi:hypothetical protein